MKRYSVLHLFCGIGGGALGFQAARPRFGGVEARFDTLLGVDFDAQACEDFEKLTGAPALCADIAELQPAQLLEACRGRAPDVVFLSAPCTGFSGLLSKKRLEEEHYQKLNRLMALAVNLVCATWRDRLPKLIVSENVPRIVQRGQDTLREVRATLHESGYLTHEDSHDCGEIGGLAQSRKRWLLVARHEPQVATFLYEPPKLRVRGIGEVIGPMPMPDDPRGGSMHRTPRLRWKTWERLALIPAGKDWRALGRKADGVWRGTYGIVPWDSPAGAVTGNGRAGGRGVSAIADPRVDAAGPKYNHAFKVVDWAEPSGAVASGTGPSSGGVNVADPRFTHGDGAHRNKYHVADWERPAKTITGSDRVGSGALSVADPRFGVSAQARSNLYRVVDWSDPSATVTGAANVHQGAIAVGDPRTDEARGGCHGIRAWDKPIGTITGQTHPSNGAFSVADPRINGKGSRPDLFGVLRWDKPAKTISGSASVSGSNCPVACADPRVAEAVAMPAPEDVLDPVPIIVALDHTWHRPLTTLELLVLQAFPWEIDGKPVELAGKSQARHRKAIGNAVPTKAGKAMGEQFGICLLANDAGVGFMLSSAGIWVDRYRAEVRRAAAEAAA